MDLFSLLVATAGLAVIAILAVLVKRHFFPARYDGDMPEFDLRAGKLPHDLAGQAQRHALAKVVARQRLALNVQRQGPWPAALLPRPLTAR